jgi:hypothetical protein
MAQTHRRRSSKGKHRAIRVLCHTWDCATCGPYLKKKWRDHLSSKAATGPPLYFVVIPAEHWQALRDRIKAAHGDHCYVRVNLKGTTAARGWDLAVMTTAPISAVRFPSHQAAATMLTVLIGKMPFEKRISTHRRWSLPPKVKTGEWESLGRLGGNVEDTRAVLDRLGIPYVERRIGKGTGEAEVIEFAVPQDWLSTEAYEDFLEWLRLGEAPHDDTEPCGLDAPNNSLPDRG